MNVKPRAGASKLLD